MSSVSQGGQEGDARGQVAGIDGAMGWGWGVPALGRGGRWFSQGCTVTLRLGVGDSVGSSRVASQHSDGELAGMAGPGTGLVRRRPARRNRRL